MTKSTYIVIGDQKIHCAGCEGRIDRALKRVPGVQDIQASASTQKVEVTFDDSQVSEAQIQERLGKLGYEASQA